MPKPKIESANQVTFSCDPELYGAIPEPVPASKVLPGWFKNLEHSVPAPSVDDFPGETIKACMPFLDAFQAGWIIPSPVQVRFIIQDGEITYTHTNQLEVISSHSEQQVSGSPWRPPFLKWINHWKIQTPPGWSCLFVPPVNRPHDLFQCLSGVVDTDHYPSQINFPFIWTGPRDQYDEVLPAGTPIVQVIPFRRDPWTMDIREATPDEIKRRDSARKRMSFATNSYRDVWRQVKRWR